MGVIEEQNSAALSFPDAGTLMRVCADGGARVRKGELLAELDPTSARQTFEAARAAFGQARDASQRLQQLTYARRWATATDGCFPEWFVAWR